MLDKVFLLPGVMLSSWVALGRVTAGSEGLDGSPTISALCCVDVLGSMILGAWGGWLWGGGSGSSVWREHPSAGLAGASRRVGTALLHPPQQLTTGIGEGTHINILATQHY